MNPESLYDLIQEMRKKKLIFSQFARFVNFNFEHTRTVFKTELIRSYGAFLDALDAAIDDYNEAENQTDFLLYNTDTVNGETVVFKGKLAPKEKGEYEPAPLPTCEHEWHYIGKVNGKPDWVCQKCGSRCY